MERGNSTVNPRLDEEIKQEIEGMLRSGQPNRAEEFRETEPLLPEPDELSSPQDE
jgi:hypothetical protein